MNGLSFRGPQHQLPEQTGISTPPPWSDRSRCALISSTHTTHRHGNSQREGGREGWGGVEWSGLLQEKAFPAESPFLALFYQVAASNRPRQWPPPQLWGGREVNVGEAARSAPTTQTRPTPPLPPPLALTPPPTHYLTTLHHSFLPIVIIIVFSFPFFAMNYS